MGYSTQYMGEFMFKKISLEIIQRDVYDTNLQFNMGIKQRTTFFLTINANQVYLVKIVFNIFGCSQA